MSSLVRGDGNALHIFLDGGIHNLLHRAVVPHVDDFGAGALQNTAHDVDGRVVAIKQRSSGNEADFVFGLVCGDGFHNLRAEV